MNIQFNELQLFRIFLHSKIKLFHTTVEFKITFDRTKAFSLRKKFSFKISKKFRNDHFDSKKYTFLGTKKVCEKQMI